MMSTLTGNMGSLFISLLICLFASLFYVLKNIHKKKSQMVPPPGSNGWPVIGETMEFFSVIRNGCMEKFVVGRMAKYSDHVFRTHIIGEPVAVFCGAGGNKFLFSNENKLVRLWWPHSIDRITFGSSLQASTAAQEASKLKNVHVMFLKTRMLHDYIKIMDEMVHTHFEEKWENKERVVVYPLVKHYTLSLACRLFFSMENPTQITNLFPQFKLLTSGMFALPVNFPGTAMYKAIKASDLLRKEIISIMRQRRKDLTQGKASPTQDILSHMISTSSDSDELIACNALGLVIGGHETVTSVCTSIVKLLAEFPEVYEAVHNEQMEIAESKAPGEFLNWQDLQKMKYSWNVACEVMRLVPPALGSFREAITDFTYKGFSIPKGWKLHWNVFTTYKNPDFFPNPEQFDPSRFEGRGPAPYAFAPFGGGPRMCPGKEYARLVILVFMHNLSKRFKWEKVIPDEPTEFDPIPVPAKGLPVYLFPYSNTI